MKKAEIIKNGHLNLTNIVVENNENKVVDTDLLQAIRLIQKHFTPSTLSDQMGEDYDKYMRLIGGKDI